MANLRDEYRRIADRVWELTEETDPENHELRMLLKRFAESLHDVARTLPVEAESESTIRILRKL